MRTTAAVARANLRAWWKEAIPAGFVVLMFATGSYVAGAAFAGMVGIGWALGFSHRHKPIWDTIERMDGKLDQALTPDVSKPPGEVRRLHSV